MSFTYSTQVKFPILTNRPNKVTKTHKNRNRVTEMINTENIPFHFPLQGLLSMHSQMHFGIKINKTNRNQHTHTISVSGIQLRTAASAGVPVNLLQTVHLLHETEQIFFILNFITKKNKQATNMQHESFKGATNQKNCWPDKNTSWGFPKRLLIRPRIHCTQ